jgi:hypothetical protein
MATGQYRGTSADLQLHEIPSLTDVCAGGWICLQISLGEASMCDACTGAGNKIGIAGRSLVAVQAALKLRSAEGGEKVMRKGYYRDGGEPRHASNAWRNICSHLGKGGVHCS